MGRFDPPVAAFDLEGPDVQGTLIRAFALARQQRLDKENREARAEQSARLARAEERQEDLDRFRKVTTQGVGPRGEAIAQAPGIFQDQGIGPQAGGGPNALNDALSNRVTGSLPGQSGPIALPGQFMSDVEGAGFNGADPLFAAVQQLEGPAGGGIGLQRPQLSEGFVDVGDGLAFDTNFRDKQNQADFAREQNERRQIAALEEELAAAERGRFSEALGGLGDVLGPERAQAASSLAGAGATPSTAVQIATRQSPEEQEAVFARELELRRESEQSALGPELAARNAAALERERGVREIQREFGTTTTPQSPLARRHFERALAASRALQGLDQGDVTFAAGQGRDLEAETIRNFGFTTRGDFERALQSGGTTISDVTPDANATGSFQIGGGLGSLQSSGQQLLDEQFDLNEPALVARTQELKAQFPTMSAAELLDRLRSEGFRLPGTP